MTVRNQPPIVGEAVFDSGAWFTLTSRLNCADVMDAYGGLFIGVFWLSPTNALSEGDVRAACPI